MFTSKVNKDKKECCLFTLFYILNPNLYWFNLLQTPYSVINKPDNVLYENVYIENSTEMIFFIRSAKKI